MASLKDIKVNINVDTADFIKSLRQLQESIKMDNVRILKGWTKEERKELEEAKDNGFPSAMGLINDIGDDYDYCHSLTRKYIREDISGNNQMAKDIIDFYYGNAKFPEEKYVVHDKATEQYIYYNATEWRLRWGQLDVAIPDLGIPDEKTKEEWLAINPAYEAMLKKVEDDE